MAADVLKTPKFGNLKETPSYHDTAPRNGPFRATEIWHEIIDNLRVHVEIKKRRGIMKTYDHCFTGADAADVIYNHLLADKANFTNKEITREKAVKLCQLMLDNHVFESVKEKGGDCRSIFDDSVTKYYRFLDDKENEGDELERTCESCDELSRPDDRMRSRSEFDLSGDGVIGNPLLLNKHGQVVQEIMELTGTWRRHADSCLKRRMTPAKLFNVGRISLPHGTPGTSSAYNRLALEASSDVPPEVEDEVRKEVALAELLSLIDIPILDNILSYEARSTQPIARPTYSNLAFRRYESVNSLVSNNDREDDVWWEAALDCIECLPRGPDILDSSMSEQSDMTQKLRMYSSISEHYQSLDQPLWSDQFIDVQVGLLNLLMQDNKGQALRALTLCMGLLPGDLREEIKRLLVFLGHATSPDHVALSSSETNESLVMKTFTPAVIKNKMLAPHQAGQLLLFMMEHGEEIWDMPDTVEDTVRQRLRSKVHGKEQLKMDKVYCAQVSQEEFRKQQEECTEKALVAMMNHILDNTKFSLKEKKCRLKQLQKHHPKIYWKHFADML